MKKRGDDRKWLARVLAIGTECDIALLTGQLVVSFNGGDVAVVG